MPGPAHPPGASRRPLGLAGYLACLAFSLCLATLARGWCVALACAMVLGLAVAFYPVGLRALASPRLWLFLGFLLLPTAFATGPGRWTALGVGLSAEGLAGGVQMGLRAIAIVVAVAGFGASVPAGELAALTERVGLKGLGFALGVAANMLPLVQGTLTTAYQALRLRGGFHRRRLQGVRLLLATVVANSLRHADDIVSAAQLRGFSPDGPGPPPLACRRSDIALAAVLLAALAVWLLVARR